MCHYIYKLFPVCRSEFAAYIYTWKFSSFDYSIFILLSGSKLHLFICFVIVQNNAFALRGEYEVQICMILCLIAVVKKCGAARENKTNFLG